MDHGRLGIRRKHVTVRARSRPSSMRNGFPSEVGDLGRYPNGEDNLRRASVLYTKTVQDAVRVQAHVPYSNNSSRTGGIKVKVHTVYIATSHTGRRPQVI